MAFLKIKTVYVIGNDNGSSPPPTPSHTAYTNQTNLTTPPPNHSNNSRPLHLRHRRARHSNNGRLHPRPAHPHPTPREPQTGPVHRAGRQPPQGPIRCGCRGRTGTTAFPDRPCRNYRRERGPAQRRRGRDGVDADAGNKGMSLGDVAWSWAGRGGGWDAGGRGEYRATD